MIGTIERPAVVDPKTLRVAVYARRSDDDFGRSKSAAEQVQHCLRVARTYGYLEENATIYSEPDGTKGQWAWEGCGKPGPYRPQLTRMVRDIEAGRIDVVVYWRSDRMIRDPDLVRALLDLLSSKGIVLISGNRPVDYDTAEGEFAYYVEAAANMKFRKRISEDIRRDHDYKALSGMFTRDPSCLGYRSKGRESQQAVPVPQELDIVRRVFRLYVEGDGTGPMGMGEIARRLMAEGVKVRVGAKGHKAKLPDLVEPGDVKRILTNCMYVGRWLHRGVEYPCERLLVPGHDGTPEPVVPPELYDAAQFRIRDTRVAGKSSLVSDHLLSGLVVCGSCGRPMTVSHRKRADGTVRKTYVCANKQATGLGLCPRDATMTVQEDVVDGWVLEQLMDDLREKIEETRRDGRDEDQRRLTELEAALAMARDRETDQLASIVGVLDQTQIAAVAKRLRAEREDLERRASDLRLRVQAREGAFPNLDEAAVRAMPLAALKSALRKCVRFIAPTSEGIVVADTWEGYVGAAWVLPPASYKTRESRRTIGPRTVEASLSAFGWLPDPELFVKGRRFALGRSAEFRTDEELLPGITEWRRTNGTD